MKRWLFLALLLGASMSGCARADVQVPRDVGVESVVLPAGPRQLVAQLRFTGGYVPTSWPVIEAPALAVYSDGLAVADVDKALMLPRQDLGLLVGELRRDLAGQPKSVEPLNDEEAYDAGSTTLVVLAGDGTLQSVSAYAMGFLDYPKPVVAARDRLKQLTERVRRDGTPYTADRIRIVAEERTTPPTEDPRPWPATVPVPPRGERSGVRVADLSGAAATAAERTLTRDQPQHNWPVHRTSDGLLLGAAWRYLLPDE